MSDDYLHSTRRKVRRGIVGTSSPLIGAGIGYGLGGKYRRVTTPIGAVGGYLLGRKLNKRLDIRDVKREGLHKVDSSMIRGARHAPEGSYIQFNTGKLYRYGDVSRAELNAMRRAESAGKHFNSVLKKRKYERL
jgi:uncharacterized protein YcfJ